MTTAMKSPEQEQEFALRDQVGFAGFVDQLGNLAHRAMDRQVLQPRINHQAEYQPKDAEQDSEEQQLVPVDAQEIHRRQIRQLQVRFAARRLTRRLRVCCGRAQKHYEKSSSRFQRGAAEIPPLKRAQSTH